MIFRLQIGNYFLSIVGLSAGIALVILLFTWIQSEESVYFSNKELNRVAQVIEHQTYVDNIVTTTSTPGILAEALMDELPEIQWATSLTWPEQALLEHESQKKYFSSRFASVDFFQIFPFEIIAGNADDALKYNGNIVISEHVAQYFFTDSKESIGKTLIINGEHSYRIAAVYKSNVVEQHLPFDVLLPYREFLQTQAWAQSWVTNGPSTFIKIAKDASFDDINVKIKDFIKIRNEGSNVELEAYPFQRLHLYGKFQNGKESGGRIQMVQIVLGFTLLFGLITGLIFSAFGTVFFPFVDNSKRILGFGISVFLVLGLSLLFLTALFYPFNIVAEKALLWTDVSVQHIVAVLLTVVGLLGLKLLFAIFLEEKHSARFQTYAQFTLFSTTLLLSLILMTSTWVVFQQLTYIEEKNVGFDANKLALIHIDPVIREHAALIKQQLSASPKIESVSFLSSDLSGRNANFSAFKHWDRRYQVLTELIFADSVFVSTAGLTILREMPEQERHSISNGIFVNEALGRLIGKEDPVGEELFFLGENWIITGLLKDFHYQSLHNIVAPAVIVPNSDMYHGILVRFKETVNLDYLHKALSILPGNPPVRMVNLQEQIAKHYHIENKTYQFLVLFSLFSLVLSFWSLVSLQNNHVLRFGQKLRHTTSTASSRSITYLKAYAGLWLVTFLISIPASLWLSDRWLQRFAFTFEPGLHDVFAPALFLLVLLSLTQLPSFRSALIHGIKK